MRRSDPGFSLLEVMAAVAVVAIVFTTLARVANQGLYSEGLSKRRLEASLLADEAVSDLELTAATGQLPTPGTTQVEADPYLVTIDVRLFDLMEILPLPEGAPPPSAQDEEVEPFWAQEVKVTVTWPEGFDEGSVSRMTYLVDLAGQAGALDESGLPAGLDVPAGLTLPGGPTS